MKQATKPVLHPVLLNKDEIKNPYKAIELFFDVDWLSGHLEVLKYWRRVQRASVRMA